MTSQAKAAAGLEGVVATSSRICYLDGRRGVLAYCGHDIHDLARHTTFEEVCHLLWHGRLPTRRELGDLQTEFARHRALPDPVVRMIRTLPSGHMMDAVRTGLSVLAHYDPDVEDDSAGASLRKAVRVTAQAGTLVATLGRVAAGGGPMDPDPVLGHAANFLYLLTGERPSELATRAFDVALILHADHELNASTFAARVAAATLTDIHSTIVAGVTALKGPLHGGANAEVMKLLMAIGEDAEEDRVTDTIRGMLARKQKVPGFGHRVYRTEDPRATHLRQMSRDLGEQAGKTRWLEISQRVEAVMKEETGIDANVDFYSASTYHTLGIAVELFTPIFVVSRVAGWTAHVLEQYANNRLIRPRADYVGPSYPQPFVPLADRS
ncbi:MAG: citrate/2-methylcitrate synthase [Acidobacteriota bacterium]|nr:citrate/2-methylcitrate synthase [Acidobacteriota bacterium]